MTKVQNKMQPVKVHLSFFLLLVMHLSINSQDLPADRELSMLALGDSYTIGESVEAHERWPHQFAARLREEGVPLRNPDYIATTGWTTGELLEGISSRLDQAREYDLVSILIGVNNQYRKLDIDLYEPELRLIIDRAIGAAGGDSSRVFMLSIPDYAYTPFGNGDRRISKELDVYNEIAQSVAAEYAIDFYKITPISRKGLADPGLLAADGLHPSALQYGLWVEELLNSEKFCFLKGSDDFREILEIFYQQEKDWNAGDIDAFMEAYWKSEDLQFGGANGITKGWKNTLERYKSGYPDKATMGKLNFQIKDMSRHSEEVISLTGSWELVREHDRPGGHFLLIWRKIDGHWKIVVDHTSQKPPE